MFNDDVDDDNDVDVVGVDDDVDAS
jgi:hypothetical protein